MKRRLISAAGSSAGRDGFRVTEVTLYICMATPAGDIERRHASRITSLAARKQEKKCKNQ